MNKKRFFILLVVLLVLIMVFVFNDAQKESTFVSSTVSAPASTVSKVTSTPIPISTSTSKPVTKVASPTMSMSLSDGAIAMSYPSSGYGVAATTSQILVHTNIPPCDAGFDYCIYYYGSAYQGTTFESAGVRIAERSDFAAEAECLGTDPVGWDIAPIIMESSVRPSSTGSMPTYATSVFSPLDAGAAGQLSTGAVYRLWYAGSPGEQAGCYEFETRIGQSDFGNYPPGSIQQFTSADQAVVQAQLASIMQSVTLPDGEQAQFPAVQATASGK